MQLSFTRKAKQLLAVLLFFSLYSYGQPSSQNSAVNPVCNLSVDAITGPKNACANMGATGTPATYSVAAVNAASFVWIIPGGSTGFTGQGTNTISFKYPDNFVSGTVRVIVSSLCGDPSITKIDTISKAKPATPGTISGPLNACPYFGTGTEVVYSIANVPYANGYSWTAPAGVTITRGQGTNTIAVNFDMSFIPAYIKVKSLSGCGNSADKSLRINLVRPIAPALIKGPTNPCPYIGTANEAVYTIKPVINATSYVWTMPAGATATHPEGDGANDTIVKVIWDNSFVSNTNISVASSSICGTSGVKNLTIKRIQAPTPGLITGPTNACPLMVSATNPAGTAATYLISKVALATGYSWTVPAGCTIQSHPGGIPGSIDDTSIVVIFDASFIGSSLHPIRVVSTNGCGNSAIRAFTVSRLIPSTPGIISGPTDPCPLIGLPEGVTYTIKKVANATSYTWAVPNTASIRSHPGGEGTIDDTIIVVDYSASVTSGNISVTAHNNCWTSGTKSLPIVKRIASQPGVITAALPGSCPARHVSYSIATYPAYASSIVWTVPAGAQIMSGQGTTTIDVVYPDNAVLDTVSVTALNNCSTSASRKLPVNLPACGGLMAGSLESRTTLYDPPAVEISNSLVIYPNPSVNTFTALVKAPVTGKLTMKLMDMMGREIKQLQVTANQAISFGAELKPGTYIVEIKQGDYKISKVLVKIGK